MEWVIAVLGVGCIFFAFQVIIDYIQIQKVDRAQDTASGNGQGGTEGQIEASKAGLDETQVELSPIKEEVDKLEQEYLELQQQIQQERAKQRPRPIRFKS